MLIEINIYYGYPSEIDYYLTQAVLQYLCLRNLKCAEEFYDHYVNNHPTILKFSKLEEASLKYPYEKFPLVNFLKFLLASLKK
jgi:hypothetical protein